MRNNKNDDQNYLIVIFLAAIAFIMIMLAINTAIVGDGEPDTHVRGGITTVMYGNKTSKVGGIGYELGRVCRDSGSCNVGDNDTICVGSTGVAGLSVSYDEPGDQTVQDEVQDEETVEQAVQADGEEVVWQTVQPVLNRTIGVVYGPSGRETYYNLDMSNCVFYMRQLGYEADTWVRNDGVKMFGSYIMLASDTTVRPKGTILKTTLGTGIVVDHCEAAASSGEPWVDVAVTW